MDLCPRPWWDLVWYYDEGVGHPVEKARMRPIADVVWRLIFYVTCLPLCYPCYLTRTLRKRTNDELREVHPPTIDNGVRKALFQTVASTKSHKQKDEIEVNVIFLKSMTSETLERVFYGGQKEELPSSYPPWLPPMQRSTPMVPELEAIPEDNEVNDVQAVQLPVGNGSPPSTPTSRPTVKRHLSHAGAADREPASLSESNISDPAEEDDVVVDGSKDEEGSGSAERVTPLKLPRYLFHLRLIRTVGFRSENLRPIFFSDQ